MPTQGYAHPELLAETDWLAAHLLEDNIRIVDCDSTDAYVRAHIPGSVTLGVNHYIKDPDNEIHVMPPSKVAALMSSLGIDKDTLVIAYEGRNQPWAARLWWVLNYYGHTKVKLLNGGFRAWISEGRPVTDVLPEVVHKRFTPKVDASLIVTAEEVRKGISDLGTVLWDVRSLGEHRGDIARGNKYTGHIPDAVHLEWKEVVQADGTGRFRSADEIRAILEKRGITPDKQVYTY